MDDEAAVFMEDWLEENVVGRYDDPPSPRELATLAVRCVADARAIGVTLENLEGVVGDIEEAIQDEIEFQAAVRSLATKH